MFLIYNTISCVCEYNNISLSHSSSSLETSLFAPVSQIFFTLDCLLSSGMPMWTATRTKLSVKILFKVKFFYRLFCYAFVQQITLTTRQLSPYWLMFRIASRFISYKKPYTNREKTATSRRHLVGDRILSVVMEDTSYLSVAWQIVAITFGADGDNDDKDAYTYRPADGSLMIHHVRRNVTQLLVDRSIFVSFSSVQRE